MNAILWILQLLLAMTFLIHGRLMISPPQPMPKRMAERLGYVLELPPGFRRFIGLAELVAPVGLILPGATGIFPGLYLARP